MDKIYIELIQKDSLLEQAQINSFKELKHMQIIDSTRKNINAFKSHINALKKDYYDLSKVTEKKQNKIIRQRKIGLVMLGVIVLQILL